MKNLPCQESKTYIDLIDDVVSQLVDEPDFVTVAEKDDDTNWLRVRITVAVGDKGKVIGRQGVIIGALHTLLVAISRGRKVSLDVVETTPE